MANKKKTITYQGHEYRLVKRELSEAAICKGCAFEHGHCADARIVPGINLCTGADGMTWDHVWNETPRSRLSHWWREWVKRNIVDEDPYENETHSAARYLTLDEVNARRGYPTEEPKEGHDDN